MGLSASCWVWTRFLALPFISEPSSSSNPVPRLSMETGRLATGWRIFTLYRRENDNETNPCPMPVHGDWEIGNRLAGKFLPCIGGKIRMQLIPVTMHVHGDWEIGNRLADFYPVCEGK